MQAKAMVASEKFSNYGRTLQVAMQAEMRTFDVVIRGVERTLAYSLQIRHHVFMYHTWIPNSEIPISIL